MLIVATYERLLSEKESRLMDLRASLETERQNVRRLSEALAREQAIHATLMDRLTVQTAPEPVSAPAPKTWLSRLLQR